MPSILVVDDERLGRTVLSKMLRAGGHGVTETVNGQQALSYLEHHLVDVVVTDVIMPKKDGLETISGRAYAIEVMWGHGANALQGC